jgi:hypothetical protein
MATADGSASFAKYTLCVEGNKESIPIAENEEYRIKS